MPRRLIVEADGGSRGNPGQTAYGAVVRDAATGELLAEVAESIGVASNNVAEYRGVIAGLEAARDIDPAASVDVRLDSKLVVEHLSGRWKVKHPSMRELALRAQSVRPSGDVRFTWVPREQNAHADRLVNAALDGRPIGDTGGGRLRPDEPELSEHEQSDELPEPVDAPPNKLVGWAHDLGEPTVFVLLRHGETEQ